MAAYLAAAQQERNGHRYDEAREHKGSGHSADTSSNTVDGQRWRSNERLNAVPSLESDICANYLLDVRLVHRPTYSVAFAKGIPMKVGLSVSVYISIPVPRR